VTEDVATALRYARSHRQQTIRRLVSLLGYPTVSADPRHAEDMSACAQSLAAMLRRIGLRDVRVHPGRVAPYVTGSRRGRSRRPTVLIYGHYDVQPVGPTTAWVGHPFVPTVRGRYLYGRGASDNKGQFIAHLAAIEAWLATSTDPPVSLHVILDGEEEVGSPTLLATVDRWPHAVADVVVASDTRMLAPDIPVLTTGLRGQLGARIEICGSASDLHAGAFGGAVANPAEVLADVIASLHDTVGRVAIAGFYDHVQNITAPERRYLARTGPTDTAMLAPARDAAGFGEPGFSAFERATRRPAVIVTNLHTSGRGRTVVPAWAAADLSVRLVPGQRVPYIAEMLRGHVADRILPGMRGRLILRKYCPPYALNEHSGVLPAVRRACREGFGRAPVLLPSGGSIPFISTLAATHEMDAVLLGFALPDDARHAANERMYLGNLFRGTDTCIRLYRHLGVG
jgi:acetylornithine deacetylase/succinyl-diaminopimelate desuccinylase-like protein